MVKGVVKWNININGIILREIDVLIVPDMTMRCPIVLGRQTIAWFGFRLTKPTAETVDKAISEIFNIDPDVNVITDEFPQISDQVSFEVQDRVMQLFETMLM